VRHKNGLPSFPSEKQRKSRIWLYVSLNIFRSTTVQQTASCGMSGGGSGSDSKASILAPPGVYNVTLTVSGPNNLKQTAPIQFTVTPAAPGQS